MVFCVWEANNQRTIVYDIVSNIFLFGFVENDRKTIKMWLALVTTTKIQEIRWYLPFSTSLRFVAYIQHMHSLLRQFSH